MGRHTTLDEHLRPAGLRRRGALKWLASLAGLSVACAAQPAAEPPAQGLVTPQAGNAHATEAATPANTMPASATPAPATSTKPVPASATPAPIPPPISATPAIPQPAQANSAAYVRYAAQMRQLAVDAGDQAYGAIIVKGDRVVGLGPSRVVVNTDATAHAEMEAIRDASRRLGSSDLSGCVMYSTSRPCAMCESAAYWARITRLIHGSNAADAGSPRYGACG